MVRIFCCAASALAVLALAYSLAPSPLMTEWGAKITPENAWRQYPLDAACFFCRRR